jgi:integrase
MALYRPVAVVKLPDEKTVRRKSPYWAAQFRSAAGRIISISTKLSDKRKARCLESVWVRAAEESRNGWMTAERAQSYLSESARICKGDSLRQSEKFLNDCLKISTGAGLFTPTAAEYFHSWIQDMEQKGYASKNTIARYEPVLRRFTSSLPEGHKLNAVTAQHIKKFLVDEQQRGVSAVSANQSVQIIKIGFNQARKEQVISSNPCDAVKLFRENPDTRQAFTDEQVRSMFQVASIEWKGMLLMGYQAGIRISDAAKLSWSNIDLQNRTLTFVPQKTAGRKNGKPTIVRFHPEIAEYLEGLPVSDDPNSKLFPTLSRRPSGSASGLSALFKRHVMTPAGIASPMDAEKSGKGHRFSLLSYHSLRHSFCARMANAEVGSDVRMALAGHASQQIHEGYLHMDLERQDKALQKLERAA